MKLRLAPLLLLLLLIPFAAASDSPVTANQGAPGKQGPWPVSVTGGISISIDGGVGLSTAPVACMSYRETNTTVGASAAIVPATPLTGRAWVRICNSLLNTESAQCICSVNAVPTFAASSLGDVLAVSDCAFYTVNTLDGGAPRCICNGAGVQLPASECSYTQ